MINLENENPFAEMGITYSQIIDMVQGQPLEVQKFVVDRIMPMLSADINNLFQRIWLISSYLYFIVGVSFARGGALIAGLKNVSPLLKDALSEMKIQQMSLKDKIGERYDPALEPAIEDLEKIVRQMLDLTQGYIDQRFRKPTKLRETTSKLLNRLGMNFENLQDVLKSHAGRKPESLNDSLYRVAERYVLIYGRKWKKIAELLFKELMAVDKAQLDEDRKVIRKAWENITGEYRIEQLRKTFNTRNGKN